MHTHTHTPRTQAWMDTANPRFYNQTGGVWILGSRFIAAAREAMFWLRALGAEYRCGGGGWCVRGACGHVRTCIGCACLD